MANYYNENTLLYLNGRFVKAAEATMDFYSQSLHYGYSVFEGIRSYKTVDGSTKIFKPVEHYNRLQQSATTINLPYHWDTAALIRITDELLALNQLGDAYIRPVVYAPANMTFSVNTESFLVIQAWEMAPFLGEKLLRVRTSSFQRPNPGAFHLQAKAAGHYVNSILASQEAKAKGFDEALLLDMQGNVAEAPGANIFIEKNGKLVTPPAGHILPGITRATVLELASSMDIPVEEAHFTVQDIYEADAAFYCGTAAEVIGFESLDNRALSLNWADTVSKKIQQAYKNLVVQQPIQANLNAVV
jgi:branched-chain amino acid aminotransferase